MTPQVAEAAEDAHGTNPWRNPDFRRLWVGRLAAVLAIQTQGAALLWQVYDIARRDHPIEQASLYLGLIGLCQFLPLMALTLPAGEMADRLDRKLTVILSIMVEGLCAVLFLGLALHGSPPLWALLAVAALFGAARAFLAPASQAFLPMVVGRAALPRAIAAQSIAFQTGSIAAPAIAGLIVGIAVPYAYATALALFCVGLFCISTIRTSGKPRRERTPFSPRAMFDAVNVGLKYVWNTKVVLGAISLDLVVVLLAGVALLTPIFARDIFHVGAEGFGILRASFGLGALLMAGWLARFPIVRRGGAWMFGAVALFGVSALTFGVAGWGAMAFGWTDLAWVAGVALFLAGAADMISVNIRQTLIQLATPDEMRGRVSSVSMLFIGASNELGEFYTGFAVRILGPIGAALFGGSAAIASVGLWSWLFPGLRKADRLG
ncbi:MAG: MFS transporter [Alphaproteobacteria bacterium]|nr:MFS transporter [Alphaproteobacteria bacterium]MBU1527022.1 MFS transporter [Alphaproteobacteria bacterium]MBU2116703.1 MFS transporter [Alphaproteobacteria bacterium]MBU2352411.1 MFS transporter [Alphaproteobacteria bacterium]MBU2382171.1 MFS transporter [Alphaproteobacteria bacterium]